MKCILILVLAIAACQNTNLEKAMGNKDCANVVGVRQDSIVPAQFSDGKLQLVNKTADEWRHQLTEMEYYVLREEGTERSFSGDLWDHHEHGVYVCAGCGLPLFSSDTKFDSGTGWPSFWKPISKDCIADKSDKSHGMSRMEVECARCGGHQGHVFDDGPAPTGLRYCINSVSLNFVKQ
jgi:peptide-methionine (R)-S-oxide reductase